VEAHEFQGRIGRYHWESEPWWPPEPSPPAGAPNVLIVVLDDVGYAQLGCFGSDIRTPTFDRLAAGGLRYSNFHTTALCSPTRASVLTGRNHHRVGMGRIVDLATGFPGYDARIPASCAMAPAMLTPQGYAAWAVGKWHLTPEDEEHLGATRVRWPLSKGFERWYGFFGGETHQYVPALIHDSHAVDPPGSYEDGYHLSTDLVDHAIEYLEDLRHVDVDKPWFTYLALGACHSPHQAPAEWIDGYRGHFDRGWDEWRERALRSQQRSGLLPAHTVLSERPEWVPAWDDLTDVERRVHARYMEAFAGFLSHADHEVGRLVDRIESMGELERTLIIVLSDNGASSEGGPSGSLNDGRVWNALPRTIEEADEHLAEIGGPRFHNNYAWGWTVAGNTPFRRWKRETHEGGVADPLVVHWPGGIPESERGGIRHQYVHAIDVLPTILDAVGVTAPEVVAGVPQVPLDGVSFASTFADAEAAEVHTVQYSEMLGCRALYQDGWKAVSHHEVQVDEPGLDRATWELHDLRSDPSETVDLAEQHPERLAAMVDRWWVEAERNQVLPLDNRPFSELVFNRTPTVPPRRRYRYWPGRAPVPESVAVNVRARPHTVTAQVTVPGDHTGPVEGVLIQQGSVLGGWSFHLVAGRDGGPDRLVFVHNLVGWRSYRTEAGIEPLGPGDHELVLDVTLPGVELLVDGRCVGRGELRRSVWSRFSLTGAGLTAGWAPDFSAGDADYRGRFDFTAVLRHVDVDVPGDPVVDADAEAQAIIASQ